MGEMNGTWNYMEYMEGMEVLKSDLMEQVLGAAAAYDYDRYEERDVIRALEEESCTAEGFAALLSPAAAPFLEQMARKAGVETAKHFGNSVNLFTPLYIANYCDNYCIYCGFNCHNRIRRARLRADEIEQEMEAIARTGLEEILILTGESRRMSDVEYIIYRRGV